VDPSHHKIQKEHVLNETTMRFCRHSVTE